MDGTTHKQVSGTSSVALCTAPKELEPKRSSISPKYFKKHEAFYFFINLPLNMNTVNALYVHRNFIGTEFRA